MNEWEALRQAADEVVIRWAAYNNEKDRDRRNVAGGALQQAVSTLRTATLAVRGKAVHR